MDLASIVIIFAIILALANLLKTPTISGKLLIINNLTSQIIGLIIIISLKPQLNSAIDIIIVYLIFAFSVIAVLNCFLQKYK